MAGLFSNITSIDGEIEHCRRREREEREAADRSQDISARDAHLALAERYAEKAWSLAEAGNRAARRAGHGEPLHS